jgi:peptide/nickel transport system substrate-binding protein
MEPRWNLVDLLRDADETTRREFLSRASVTGLSTLMLGAHLTACGGAAQATATTAPAVSTAPAVVPTAAINQPTAVASKAPGASAGPAASASSAPATSASAAPSTAAAAVKKGGQLTLMGHQEIASLAPDDAGPIVHYVIVANIHSPLLVLDENYTVQPDLAESFTAAPDGKTYTFKLRRGVTWHDGTPFTSADVKYTYEFYADPKNAAILQPVFKDVATVATPDDFTAVVNLKVPNAPFIILAATQLIIPKHHHSKVGKDAFKKAPIGTGPFRIKEWKPQEYTTIEAYDGYYQGRPNLDRIRENIVPEPSVRTIALDTDAVDSSVWPLAPEDTLRLMADAKFAHFRAPGTAVNHFSLNNKKPQFQDKRVRQAMLHAINRDPLVLDLLKGLAVKATSNLSPAVEAFYNKDVVQYDYNPTKANQLLDEAWGKPGGGGIRVNAAGEKLSFTCFVIIGDALRRSEAELVQRDLKAVGIEMKLQDFGVAEILSKARAGDYDSAIFNSTYGTADPDASTTLRTGALNNFSHYSNPRVDELLDQGLMETDPAKRAAIYKEIQEIVAEDVPFLYIMYWETVLLFNKRIKGLPAKATNPYAIYTVNSHRLWFDK